MTRLRWANSRAAWQTRRQNTSIGLYLAMDGLTVRQVAATLRVRKTEAWRLRSRASVSAAGADMAINGHDAAALKDRSGGRFRLPTEPLAAYSGLRKIGYQPGPAGDVMPPVPFLGVRDWDTPWNASQNDWEQRGRARAWTSMGGYPPPSNQPVPKGTARVVSTVCRGSGAATTNSGREHLRNHRNIPQRR